MSKQPHIPPRWAKDLLRWFCAPHLLEEMESDLDELFQERVESVGLRQARWRYWRDVLSLMRPWIIKRKPNQYSTPNDTDMLRSYLKIAWRNIVRSKSFTAINVFGLTLGLTSSLLIYLWVVDETSVDAYHTNGPHLYRIMERVISDGKREAYPETRWPISLELPKKFPQIVHAAGFAANRAQLTFTVGQKTNKETGDWAGADWFTIFSVPLLAGTPQTALRSPNSLAISRKVAESYFGSFQAAIGKSIRVDNKADYQVTAVFDDLPSTSSLQYDFLLSWDDFKNRNEWAVYWEANNPQAFIQLRPDADVTAFQTQIKHFMREHHRGIDAKHLNRYDVEIFLQPFEEMYLHAKTENGQIVGGRIEYVRLFSVVAVFLLLIACINFMNLATARSAKRAREVGVRKAVGATHIGLIGQFVGEAMLLTAISVILATLLATSLLPTFNQLTGKSITIPYNQPSFILSVVLAVLITGVLSGSYPALFLSSLQPIQVLKGKFQFKPGSARLRQGLVVVQFAISLLLLISTFVVYRQVDYIQTKNLGFDRENLLSIPLEGNLLTHYPTFQHELQRMPGIAKVSRIDHQPTNIGSVTSNVDWAGKDPTVIAQFNQVSVGYDLATVLKLKLKDGRAFSPTFATDSVNYLINEQAAKLIGYAVPLGQSLTLNEKKGTIIGIVQDFHFQSLHEPIKPLILSLGENANFGHLLVRTQPGQTKQALNSLQVLTTQINPGFPFTYSFVDADYQQLYRSEQAVSALSIYFAVLAVLIACLGLFGLSSLLAEQRTKEIGIRKVLGASVISVAGLLAGDLLKLVGIAIIFSSPLAWYTMNRWLQGFAYKIDIEWWVFVVAGLLAVAIALLTVSFQSVKAALVNPVKSLRSE